MKISEILKEAQITPYQRETLSGDITGILAEHCSDAYQTARTPIWRGTGRNKAEIMMLDPSTGTRRSENTTNYYTMLMDNSPYMKGFPKRSNSLICTTRRKVAESYGNGKAYAIFPYNGTKIAICPGSDLWDTTVDLTDLRDGGVQWDDINHILKNRLGFSDDATFQQMIEYTNSDRFRNLLSTVTSVIEPEKFIAWLQQQMAPEKVGFVSMDISTFDASDYPDNEVWFSGPCIAIRDDIYDAWIKSNP